MPNRVPLLTALLASSLLLNLVLLLQPPAPPASPKLPATPGYAPAPGDPVLPPPAPRVPALPPVPSFDPVIVAELTDLRTRNEELRRELERYRNLLRHIEGDADVYSRQAEVEHILFDEELSAVIEQDFGDTTADLIFDQLTRGSRVEVFCSPEIRRHLEGIPIGAGYFRGMTVKAALDRLALLAGFQYGGATLWIRKPEMEPKESTTR